MEYNIEYCLGLKNLRDYLEGQGTETTMPDKIGWEKPDKAMGAAIGKMMEPFRYDLSSQFITIYGEGIRRHFFKRNPRFNRLRHAGHITFKGFEISLRTVLADMGGPRAKDCPLPQEDIIELSCDGQVWHGGFIGPYMDDEKITSVLNACLDDIYGWNFGKMDITYSDDIVSTALLQGIKLPENVSGLNVEDGEHLLFDIYLGFLKPYNLKGQWIEISDGLNTRRIKFTRSKMLRKILTNSRQAKGPIRTYMAEVETDVEAGALEPQSLFGIFEIGGGKGVIVSPYWPDWAVEAQYYNAVKKSVECVIGED